MLRGAFLFCSILGLVSGVSLAFADYEVPCEETDSCETAVEPGETEPSCEELGTCEAAIDPAAPAEPAASEEPVCGEGEECAAPASGGNFLGELLGAIGSDLGTTACTYATVQCIGAVELTYFVCQHTSRDDEESGRGTPCDADHRTGMALCEILCELTTNIAEDVADGKVAF